MYRTMNCDRDRESMVLFMCCYLFYISHDSRAYIQIGRYDVLYVWQRVSFWCRTRSRVSSDRPVLRGSMSELHPHTIDDTVHMTHTRIQLTVTDRPYHLSCHHVSSSYVVRECRRRRRPRSVPEGRRRTTMDDTHRELLTRLGHKQHLERQKAKEKLSRLINRYVHGIRGQQGRWAKWFYWRNLTPTTIFTLSLCYQGVNIYKFRNLL